MTYTISGSATYPGVKMNGFPGPEDVITDAAGKYTTKVPWNWSGTVTPEKKAYQFEPKSRPVQPGQRRT